MAKAVTLHFQSSRLGAEETVVAVLALVEMVAALELDGLTEHLLHRQSLGLQAQILPEA